MIEVASGVYGRLAPVIAAHAQALMDNDADAIYSAAKEFEEIGSLLSAADAAAQAAVAFEANSNRRGVTEAAAMADRLATACGGIRTPALELAANPLPLSTREREIANLSPRGFPIGRSPTGSSFRRALSRATSIARA